MSFCSNPIETNVYSQDSFTEFVDMQCRARHLKKQRFSLADALREDPDFVTNPDSLKNVLAQKSRLLADSIRLKLELLTSDMELEEKRVFNDSLEARIAEMNCK
ncbi:MAG TPA: hypothetical protein VJ949_11305 [Cryomorphaceae bacterium]|nr:hypothetical protein [Cryomorphaceae bacterium]